MKQVAAFSALLLALSACTNAAEQKQSTDYEITTEALAGHIETLASDEFGGRAPGTKGEDLTVAYLEKMFKQAGLKPANNGQYTQAVPLVSIETLGSPEMVIKGAGGTLALTHKKDQVMWTRRQQKAVSVAESDLVFVGYGINAPERGWNDYEGVDVKGKTVLMLVNDPGFITEDPALFNGKTMTYYGRWTYKFDEAARQGAAAAIIIHQTKPAAYPWSTVENSWVGPQFGMVREEKGQNFSPIESWVTTDVADKLFAMAGLNRSELESAAAKPGFKAVPMTLKMSAGFENSLGTASSQNVAAYVEGSEKPDEFFIYMAHWDHLGTDPNAEGDGIYNGALDNASGTGGLLEIARRYAGTAEKPKRSVLFLAVAAEEQGLLGSAYYAENPLFPLSKTVGGINMDGLNYYGPTYDLTVVGLGNSELDDYLEAAAKAQARVLVPDQHPEKGYFYRSDHFSLAKKGVPMLYPDAGFNHREKGREYVEVLTEDYINNRYHKPADEYDENWVLTGAVEDLNLFYTAGRLVANSTEWPNWHEGTEFKQIRDQQLASP